MSPSNSPSRYHPLRIEKEITDRNELLAIIRGRQFLTIAMCGDNEPYLVTLNYAFAEKEECFYVHCANAGKKLNILRANPRVWGQIVEDRGYVKGQCTHAYRAVMFEGMAEFIDAPEEKRRALDMMIERFEPDPTEMKARLTPAVLMKTTVLRFRVVGMSGKQSPAAK
jgi:hypothetical protein